MAAIYAIFEPNILGFQFFFSSLTAEPTNRPPVRDYDPDTPLNKSVKIEQFLLLTHNLTYVVSVKWSILRCTFLKKIEKPVTVPDMAPEPKFTIKSSGMFAHAWLLVTS